MVTFPEWPRLAERLAQLRSRIAIGLHINFTVGAPLGEMPKLAPAGIFPSIGVLTLAGGRGGIDTMEIAAQTARQFERFVQHTGFAPDFIDGHQHVHVLPGVRKGVLAALRMHTDGGHLLIRDPSDDMARIVKRGVCVAKAMQVAALAMGFAKAARAAGLRTNAGFSGFSSFNTSSLYARELEAGFTATGPRQLMMCHPGHVDEALESRDGVTVRREQEFRTLMTAGGLKERLWLPDRGRIDFWGANGG